MRDCMACLLAAGGWTVELRGDQTLADLHRVLRAVLRWRPVPDYRFALAGEHAPALHDPAVLAAGDDAALVTVRDACREPGSRVWHVRGQRTITPVKVERWRRAYPAIAYPRIVHAPARAKLPTLAVVEDPGEKRLAAEAARWGELLDQAIEELGSLPPGKTLPRARMAALAGRLRRWLEWVDGRWPRYEASLDDPGATLLQWLDEHLIEHLMMTGKFDVALELLAQLALVENPEYWLERRFFVLMEAGREQEAAEQMYEIISRFPGGQMAAVSKASALDEKGRLEEASAVLRHYLDRVAEDDPRRLTALKVLGDLLERRGQPAEAARVRQQLDFVRRVDERWPEPDQPPPPPRAKKVGRNDPCPCGSGRKYKVCCGKPFAPSGPDAATLKPLILGVSRFADSLEDALLEAMAATTLHVDVDLLALPIGVQGAQMVVFQGAGFDYRAADGLSLADRFAAERGPQLQPAVNALLDRLRASCLSLYQVVEAEPGVGLEMADLLRGGRVRVRERTASRTLRRWDILAARVVEMDGTPQLVGMVPIPLIQKDLVLECLRQSIADHRELFPDDTLEEVLKAVGSDFLRLAARPAWAPELRTTDSEELVFARAHFRVADAAVAAEALRGCAELDEEEPGKEYVWVRRGDRAVSLGRITLAAGRLTLECLSKERVERGVELLQRTLGVDPLGVEFTDARRAIAEARERPAAARGPGEGLPPEALARFEHEVKARHYAGWLDEPLPALGGATPRAAAATPEGRRQVADLLRSMEHMEGRGQRAPYDFGWMWAELGLSPTEGL